MAITLLKGVKQELQCMEDRYGCYHKSGTVNGVVCGHGRGTQGKLHDPQMST